MQQRIITSAHAPQPIGPYSQAVEAGEFLFISGQIPLDPVAGTLCGATIGEQARQALANLKAVLAEAGLAPSNLVKTTVFLRSIADFSAFNVVYEEALDGAKPARSVVEVGGLPRGALVEIEAIACR
jgi:2-iminobutanoate/2-iminopropanoate deaminase